MKVGNMDAYASHQSVSHDSSILPNEMWWQTLGTLASSALMTEATLTPKPALVDKRGSGAHSDLTLHSMLKSAQVLEPFFQEMARISLGTGPCLRLREKLADCGRRAEIAMHQATGGSNSHRGAIWCLGLLVAAAAIQEGETRTAEVAAPAAMHEREEHYSQKVAPAVMQEREAHAFRIAATAAKLAALPDRKASQLETHGLVMKRTYGVGGARVEAQSGFPHVIKIGLPHLRSRRLAGATETACLLDTLMAIMSSLDDTCLLYRGGLRALETAQSGAREVIELGGTDNHRGMARLFRMDRDLVQLGASPGGSADLLAATLFLNSLDFVDKKVRVSADFIGETFMERRN